MGEDFVPKNATTANDKWEGEDEDDVKDNWFDEEEEENEDKPGVEEQVKKKKPVRDRIAEKEERIKREQEEQERMKNLTPEEIASEKARQQKLQEEGDLLLAMDTFGLDGEQNIRANGLNSYTDTSNWSKQQKTDIGEID